MELTILSSMSELTNTLGWTLVHFSWQGVLIGLLFVCLNWLLHQSTAAARYSAGLFCLLLALLAPLLTFFWLSGQTAPIAATISYTGTMSGFVAIRHATLWDVLGNNIEYLLPHIVVLWLLGVSGLSARALIGWRLVQHYRCKDVQLSPGWINDRVQSLADSYGIRQSITVMQSLRVKVPTVIGWLKPVILIPVSVITRLDREQLAMVLAHELGHIRRYDYIVNLLQVFLETVLFYHPVVRWMSARVRQERENCCDDLVLETCGKPVVYAKALAMLEELRSMGGHIEPAVAATGGDLLARVNRIVRGRQAGYRPAKGSLMLAAIIALASTLGAQSKFIDQAITGFDIVSVPHYALVINTTQGVMPNRAAWMEGLALLPEYTARAAAWKAAEKLASERRLAQAVTLAEAQSAAVEQMLVASRKFVDKSALQLPTQPLVDQPAVANVYQPEIFESPAGEQAAEPGEVLSIVATRMITPNYPVKASKAGIEGHVTLEFSLNWRGRVKRIEVIDSYPSDVFNRNAVLAMKRFRYKIPEALVGVIRLTQTFDFVLKDDPVQLLDSNKCTRLGTGTCAGLAIGRLQVVAMNSPTTDLDSQNPEES